MGLTTMSTGIQHNYMVLISFSLNQAHAMSVNCKNTCIITLT